jgi:uncharacterized membrane protein YeaQ/YmgE (transglycosylase-associated protein family)
MNLPAILFGLILSTLYGAIFHLWRDGGLGHLLYYVILSWVGFWSGHFLAGYLGWTFISIGSLHVGLATLGSLIFLLIGYWLSLVRQ